MNKFLFVILIICSTAFSKDNLMIGKIEKGIGLDSLPDWKIDAALILASSFTDSLDYIDFSLKKNYTDSILESGRTNSIELDSLIKEFKIDRTAIIRINRLQNILGLTIYLKPGADTLEVMKGTGFANLNLREIGSDKSIYDLSLTYALQRALAEAYQDSTMFESAPKEYQTYPWETLVIGGLEFIDSKVLRKWDVFEDKVISSYILVENMWESAYGETPFIIYDTATRDTLYTKFNMYGIENYDAPTKYEINALNKFDIDKYITGKLIRVESGVEIKIFLCDVSSKGLEIIKTVKGNVENDDMELIEEKVRQLTKNLLASG